MGGFGSKVGTANRYGTSSFRGDSRNGGQTASFLLLFRCIGYDGGRSEIWSAQPDGECRVRESSADFWIERTPIFSPGPERRLAYYYQTSMASGDLDEIVVVDLEHVDRPGQGRVVYKRESDSAIDPDSLRWKNPMTLEVRINGAWTAIDATAPGEAVKP
jgi:hypothetical protein